MAPTLNEVADKHSDVTFYAVFPNKRSNYKTMGQFIEKYEMVKYNRILDEDQSVTKGYLGTVTPEAVIVNEDDEVLFRGEISDAYYRVGKRRRGKVNQTLDLAIDQVKSGQTVSQPWPKATGCFITFH